MNPPPDPSPHKGLRVAAIATGLLAFAVVIWTGQDVFASNPESVASVASALGINVQTVAVPVKTVTSAAVAPVSLVGHYDVNVKSTTTLAQASTTITAAGGKALFDFTYLHTIVAQLTAAQVAVLVKNSEFTSVQPEEAEEHFATNSGSGSTVGAPIGSSNGSIKVAIVDSGTHGQEVLNAYNSQCGDACTNGTTPILVNDVAPDGSLTDASEDNAIIQAISEGAKVINVSGGQCINDACTASTPLTADDLNTLEFASLNNVPIVVAAGNTPGYVNTYAQNSPYRSDVVAVGGLTSTDEVDSAVSSNADVFASDKNEDDGTTHYGTSFAAPEVTAMIATELSEIGADAGAQVIGDVKSGPKDLTSEVIINLDQDEATVDSDNNSSVNTGTSDQGDSSVTTDDGDNTDSGDIGDDDSGDDDTGDDGDDIDDTGDVETVMSGVADDPDNSTAGDANDSGLGSFDNGNITSGPGNAKATPGLSVGSGFSITVPTTAGKGRANL